MRIATAVIAVAFGLVVLIGFFVSNPGLLEIRLLLVEWAFILAAGALLIGVSNLISVHLQKIRKREKGSVYSILLIGSLLVTFLLGISPFGISGASLQFALDAIIFPAEATLMALLSVTLIYAGVRILRRRVNLMTIIFLVVAIFTLLAATPFPFGKLPFLGEYVMPGIRNVFAVAGARGILIGIALGALTTGLRVLFAIDRPYGGN